jgi:tyrosyl-tRNA synthetase
MAWEIVAALHGDTAADEARAEFERVFRSRELPSDMPEVTVSSPATIATILLSAGFASSNNEARRLVEQGGVRLDGERVNALDNEVRVTAPMVLQAGRRRFARLVPG